MKRIKENNVDISVIVPIYGVEKYIGRCLRSLFTQTKTNRVEFILVNDCTYDKSMDVVDVLVKEYSSINVIIINKEQNEGLAMARTTGLSMAQGDYIIHIDSDDWCEPTMLEELYNKAIENDIDIVGCDYFEEINNETKYRAQPIPVNNIEYIEFILNSKVTQSQCIKLIKRKLYDQEGVDFHLRGVDIWEDYIASVKLAYFAKTIEYLPKAFLHYVQDDKNSLSRSKMNKKKCNQIYLAINDIDRFMNNTQFISQLEKPLINRKIYAKYVILCMSTEIYLDNSELWPEVDKYLWRSPMSLYNRIILWSYINGFTSMAKKMANRKMDIKRIVEKIL